MTRITGYTALTSTQPDDVIPVVDVHDTSMASSGTTKKITVGNLFATGPTSARSTVGAPVALATDVAGSYAIDVATNPAAPVIYGPSTGTGLASTWPVLGQVQGAPVINPAGLNKVRAKIAMAALGGLGGLGSTPRVDVCVLSNSVGAGQGASGTNTSQPASGTVTFLNSDNYNGEVGRLRLWLNANGSDPGEGFIYALDARCTLGGGATANAFVAPLGTSTSGANLVSTGGTLTIAVPSSPVTQYIGVVFWDQGATSLPTVTVNAVGATMKTTPGGGTNQTSSGSGQYKVGYVPTPTPGQSVVITAGAGGTFVAGLDLVNNPGGVHVHRMCISGLVTSALLGGSNAGALTGTTGAGNQIDRVVRSAYQWCPNGPGLLIINHWDVNDWTYQNVTKTLTCTLTNGQTAFTVTAGGTLDVSDSGGGKVLSGTGLAGQTLVGVGGTGLTGTMSAAYGGTTGSYSVTFTSPVSQSGMTPSLSQSFMQQFLTNSNGTASTGPVKDLGWCAWIIGGMRDPNDGTTPAAPFSQSAFIAAQKALIIPGDPTYGNVAFSDVSQLWGSYTVSNSLGLQLSNSVHPSQVGHSDLANFMAKALLGLPVNGGVATSVPA